VVATVQLFSDFPRALTLPLQRRLVTRVVDRYIAVSRALARDIEQRLDVPPTQIQVVPNGIPLEPFESLPAADPQVRLAMAGRLDLPIVLTLARLDEQKGLTYLLRAAAQLPHVAVVIAGEGPARGALAAEVGALGIADRVSFLGFRSDIPRLLANADLFVLPSLNEGLPLAVLEAMAAARPVIATAVGGTTEVVRHRETGLLVPPSDANALASAIDELFRDSELASQLARAGRALVRRGFSSAAMARSVMAVYDELLDTSPDQS
jgi:glycosyltransferase involved in cell wall biosynthesis